MDIQQAHAYAARELRKVESDLARALVRGGAMMESYLSYLEEGSHAEA